MSKPKYRYGEVRKAFNMPRRPGESFLNAKKKQIQKEYNQSRPFGHEFYASNEWRKLRVMYRRAHPLCEECLKQGRTTPAALVDHIVEIEDGGARLDPENLQSLCFACHNRKTEGARRHRKGGGGG